MSFDVDIVWKIRNIIYVVAAVAAIILTLASCNEKEMPIVMVKSSPIVGSFPHDRCLWPPDLVPHPHLPGPPPRPTGV